MSSPWPIRREAGFTLIELLVVVTILGILLGTAVISLDLGADQRALQGYGQRLAQRIELARDRAIQNNREWGMQVTNDDYRFSSFDEYQGQWVPQIQKPFQSDAPPYPIELTLRVLDETSGDLSQGVFAAKNPTNVDVEGGEREGFGQSQALPDIVFFSSGEVSRFALDITPEFATQDSDIGIRLSTDGFRATTLATLQEVGAGP